MAPLAGGMQQVELPPSFPAVCALDPASDLKLGLPLGLLNQDVPKLSALVLYLKLVSLEFKLPVELGLLVSFRRSILHSKLLRQQAVVLSFPLELSLLEALSKLDGFLSEHLVKLSPIPPPR